MSFSNVLSSVKSGKADIAISEISYTEERAESFDFSDSYYDTTNLLIVKKSDVDKYSSLDDLTTLGITVEPSEDEYIAVAMPKGSDDLKAIINKVVAEVKGDVYSSYIAEASKYTEVVD